MSDILKNHTALQEEGETVVSKTSSGKNKLSTYPTQRNLNQLVVVVHCPINALAQKEWKWWVWFLFALRYSDWKRRLTSTLAHFTCQMYQVFTFKLHNKCFAYIPTFELLLSLYISNLTTPESFELRSYDLLINAHLSLFTGFCPY